MCDERGVPIFLQVGRAAKQVGLLLSVPPCREPAFCIVEKPPAIEMGSVHGWPPCPACLARNAEHPPARAARPLVWSRVIRLLACVTTNLQPSVTAREPWICDATTLRVQIPAGWGSPSPGACTFTGASGASQTLCQPLRLWRTSQFVFELLRLKKCRDKLEKIPLLIRVKEPFLALERLVL